MSWKNPSEDLGQGILLWSCSAFPCRSPTTKRAQRRADSLEQHGAADHRAHYGHRQQKAVHPRLGNRVSVDLHSRPLHGQTRCPGVARKCKHTATGTRLWGVTRCGARALGSRPTAHLMLGNVVSGDGARPKLTGVSAPRSNVFTLNQSKGALKLDLKKRKEN